MYRWKWDGESTIWGNDKVTTCSCDANCHENQATRLRALNRLHHVVQRGRAYKMSGFLQYLLILNWYKGRCFFRFFRLTSGSVGSRICQGVVGKEGKVEPKGSCLLVCASCCSYSKADVRCRYFVLSHSCRLSRHVSFVFVFLIGKRWRYHLCMIMWYSGTEYTGVYFSIRNQVIYVNINLLYN